MHIAKREFLRIANSLLTPQGMSFSIDKYNESVIEELIRYVHADPDYKRDATKGLLLMGGTGTGKTLLLKILHKYCNIDDVCYYVNGLKRGFWFDLVDSGRIVSDFEIHGHGTTKLQEYNTTNCLAIDDLGKERHEIVFFGNRINILREILNYRHSARMLTHITTNLPLSKISEIYGHEIESRLFEMCNIYELAGPDRRKQK